MSAGRTPSQTIGPFFAVALPWPDGPRVVGEATPGAIRIEGRVLDGIAGPVPDALVETWQRTPGGIRGFGRCATDADGRWTIVTLKPEASPKGGAGGADSRLPEAPHIALSVFARGLDIEFEDTYKKYRLWKDPERVLAEMTPCQQASGVDPTRAREVVARIFPA